MCDDAENWQDALNDFIWDMRRWMKSDPPNVDAVALKKHLQTLEDNWVKVTPDQDTWVVAVASEGRLEFTS